LTKRNTGKTYRKLLKALGYVSSGKSVLYIAMNDGDAQHSFHMACDLCHPVRDFRAQHNRIEFASGGSLQIITADRFNHDRDHIMSRGKPFKVVEDVD